MMPTSDPLVSPASLLPLADTASGGYRPMDHVPGPLRPYSASLAVVPIECGKHETTATRHETTEATEIIKDGTAVSDSVTKVSTDT